MTDKQQRFVEEYLIDLNGTQAAIRAGYSVRSATEQGSRLLSNANINHAIAVAMANRSRRLGINADRVIMELAKIALVNISDVANFENGMLQESVSPDDSAAVMAVKVRQIPTGDGFAIEREIRIHDKIKALEILGKHLGIFTDKITMEGDVSIVLVDDIKE